AAFLFEEGAFWSSADWLGNGAPATLSGGGTWTPGIDGGGGRFDGASGFAGASRPVVDTRRGFTAAAWVRLDGLGGYQTLLSQDGATASGFYLQKDGVSGRFAMAMLASDSTNAAKASAQSSMLATTGVWYHVAGVYDQPAGI